MPARSRLRLPAEITRGLPGVLVSAQAAVLLESAELAEVYYAPLAEAAPFGRFFWGPAGGVQVVEDQHHRRAVDRAHRADDAGEGNEALRARLVTGGAPEELVEVEPELGQRLRPRPVGRGASHLPGSPHAHPDAASFGLRPQGARQRALADARFARHDERAAAPKGDVLESPRSGRERLGPSEERHRGPA